MQRSLRTVLPILLLVLAATSVFGQHTMFLPKPTTTTYLDDIIIGDTLANGTRADAQRVYVLQRGGVWYWHNVVVNLGWSLNIQAADTGSGAMPRIYTRPVPTTTAVPYQMVDVAGPIYIKGLQIVGYYDRDTSALNTYGCTFIFFRRANPSPDRAEFYNNVFGNSGQAILGTFGSFSVAKFVDNKIGNDGVPPTADLGNGRIVDFRNVSLDSAIFVNNTLVNGFDRAIRKRNSVGRTGVYIIDHNTIYQNGGRYGLISLGAVGSKVQITNNLLVDPMFFGADTSSRRQSDFAEMNEFDAQGKAKMAWIFHMANAAADTLGGGKPNTQWNIAKNYWYVTPQMQAVYDSCRAMGWDPAIWAGRPVSDSIKSKIADTANAFIKLTSFAFTKITAPLTSVALYATMPEALGGTAGASSGGVWPGYDKRMTEYYRDTLDASYSTSSPAYAGGTGGFPAGDLNWFPARKAAWAVLNGVDDQPVSGVAEVYTLSQNYPNPFNPSTKIAFSIPKASQVTLKVYNLIGQEVASLVNENLNAGEHTASFNAGTLSSGVYFYTIRAGNFTSTRKMMLLK
ncbi:MAG: T9SS type A sorting domain-containing protein [Ignavibacteriae bacterium]|nr:T9SS type A sorting domain-containing protein [Ignavibacteriota bacterium]